MVTDLISMLIFTAQLFFRVTVYGLFIGLLWTPFLLSERLRTLFVSLPPDDWRLSYVLWIPLPAILWSLLFGIGLSLSAAFRDPGKASPLFVGGVDAIIIATLISVVVWLTTLLYLLPSVGVDWIKEERPKTTGLALCGLMWYLIFLVGPAYALSVLAGFGDAMGGP